MIPSDTLLTTPRLKLRLLSLADIDAHIDLTNDETLARNASRIPYPYTRKDAEAFLTLKVNAWAAGEEYAFGGFNADDRLTGNASLRLTPEGWSLGYDVHRDMRGQGYATELASVVCAFGFKTLGISEIHAGHYLDNPASGMVLKKLGFKATGEESLIFSKGRGEKVAGIEYVLHKEKFAS